MERIITHEDYVKAEYSGDTDTLSGDIDPPIIGLIQRA